MTHSYSATAPSGAAGAHPSVVILALAVGGFAIGTTEFAAMALVPYFSADLGVDAATAANAISAYALGVVVGAPLIAVFGARLPRRTLLIGLMLVYGILNILAAMAPSFPMMLALRFLCGLPHGAYFGVAALLAASLVAPGKRSQAVSRIMIGLTIATILGVPFANILGQTVGWRWGFALVGGLAALTAVLIFLYAPADAGDPAAHPMRELGALGNRQVWLTLMTGAIGFGGFFAVYTYVASTLMTVTHAAPAAIPVALALIGAGMLVGTLGAGWAADRSPDRTVLGVLAAGVLLLLIYPSATAHLASILPVLFLIGMIAGLAPVLQTRLMDVAGEAQTLAAALNHSAFNIANALGPLLAAMLLRRGFGFPVAGYVGAALALAGIGVYCATVADAKARRPG